MFFLLFFLQYSVLSLQQQYCFTFFFTIQFNDVYIRLPPNNHSISRTGGLVLHSNSILRAITGTTNTIFGFRTALCTAASISTRVSSCYLRPNGRKQRGLRFGWLCHERRHRLSRAYIIIKFFYYLAKNFGQWTDSRVKNKRSCLYLVLQNKTSFVLAALRPDLGVRRHALLARVIQVSTFFFCCCWSYGVFYEGIFL